MTATALPDRLEIAPRGPLASRVRVPGSKSITNRALLLAALADGESQLLGGLDSDDTVVMRRALEALGVPVSSDVAETVAGPVWRVGGAGGRFAVPGHSLDCGNSGTTLRFLTAALTLAPGPFVLDGNARMRERPIGDLADALGSLGADLRVEGRDRCPPVRIEGGGLRGGETTIDGRQSSQYVSAVLQASPLADRDVTLRFVDGEVVSRPYIDLTLEVMRAFGAEADWLDGASEPALHVSAASRYAPRRYAIEPDASSAAYPFCAAAIAGGQVTVAGVPERSLQADFRILELLERMGCGVHRDGEDVTVSGATRPLRALGEIDMNDFPDAVLAYAVLALFADGPTTVRNVANLRIKETDRLAALATELAKLGARTETGPDWLRIEPAPLRGAEIETYDDHRMAMAFALAGLRVPGVVILDPGCVSKTWPGYFDTFAAL